MTLSSDAPVQPQDSVEQRSSRDNNDQNLQRSVQNDIQQQHQGSTWNKPTDDVGITNVDATGVQTMYQDNSLPVSLQSAGSESDSSTDPMHQYMTDLSKVLSASSQLLNDLTPLNGSPSTQLQGAELGLADGVLQLDHSVLQSAQAILGKLDAGVDGSSGAQSGGSLDVPSAVSNSSRADSSGPAASGNTGTDSNVPVTSGNTGTDSNVPVTSGNTGTDSNVPVTSGNTGTDSNVPGTSGNTGTDSNVPVTSGNTGTDSSVPATSGNMGTDSSVPATSGNMGTDSSVPATSGKSETDSTVPSDTAADAATTVPNSGEIATSGNFTVSENGFTGPDGQPFNIRGLNATVDDAVQGFPQVLQDYPNLTAIRLNVVPSQDSMSQIDQVIQNYTSHGIVVEAEDHSGDQTDTAWYQQMAQNYKNNPYVMLETPNEPTGDAQSVANNQIAVINAIRSTGYDNPIGLQPVGGYDESNYPLVLSALGSSSQLYATPHEYYYQDDPNGAQQYFDNLKSGANSNGLFAWFDEFGNDAGDGYTPAPQGMSVIQDITAANEANQVGATFWAMDNGNHPDGTDSAFLDSDGSALTPVGQGLQSWI